ncbi:MAG: hypothetical protein EA409_10005 [Saprospirales bacterium]|nr:MAG: hypothetical protein EA409_10005 [Saprospirales bacterium]
MKILIQLLISIPLLLLFGCGSDDDNGGTTLTGDGSVTFTVAGDVNMEAEGIAAGVLVETGVTTNFSFVMSDGPGREQTFLLSILAQPGSLGGYPEPGEYTIGSLNQADFWVIYADVAGGEPFVEYGLEFPTSGKLIISSSSEKWLEGTFEFEAEGDSGVTGSPQGIIQVTEGQFRAVKE